MRQLFPVDPEDLHVTTTDGPTGFHDRLLTLIRTARHRLSLASLYLGTDTLEQELRDELEAALERAPDLRVTIVVDYSRGQRATRNGNIVSFTRALTRRFPDRLRVYVHQMPQLFGWRRHVPSPLDETIAVFHFKAIVADDTAILTGANLSDEYFHCRQCRAIEVRDRHVTDLLHTLVSTTAAHSMRVMDGALMPAPNPPHEVADAVLQNVREAPRRADPTGTWLQPVFQHPALGVHQEQELLEDLFARPDGALEIHTPYVNFPDAYTDALVTRLHARDQGATTHLVCPSGDSHSFTTGRGPKALVPGAYIYLESRIVERLRAAGTLTVGHYHRPGWVFHSKGVWHTTDTQTRTVIGSSSFGARSVQRDFDLSVMLTTDDPRLRDELAGEQALIADFAPGERLVKRVYQQVMPTLTPIFQSFL